MAEIVLGVTGSIACYKAAALASRLTQSGHRVVTIMTDAARMFITPHTFHAVTGQPVYWNPFAEDELTRVTHVDVAMQADVVVVCPATANVIAQLALGLAPNLLTTTIMACPAPRLICPAMNDVMWAQPAVQRNVAILEADGARFVMPETGALACGRTGAGRLAAEDTILAAIDRLLETRAGGGV